ncbi:MAG: hypothetical protein QOJ49_1655 [Actinomycetota bacterium]|nr:hypothetical protein [Actinomycetota bacterium]
MMAVHVLPERDPDGSVSTSYSIAAGRSAATFAVMAGVGLALLTGGTRPPAGRMWASAGAGLAVRALAIGAIGFAIGYAHTGVAVILPYYAVLFLLAVPLLPLRTRTLAVLGLLIAIVVPVVSFLIRDVDKPAFLGANLRFSHLRDSPGTVLEELALTGYYPALAWTAYLCAGLAAGRLDLLRKRVAVGLLVGGAAVAIAAAATSWLLLGPLGGHDQLAATLSRPSQIDRMLAEGQFGNVPRTSWWWLAVDSPHASTPLDLLHTSGVAIALLGAMLLLARQTWGRRVMTPVAAAGSMTLTLYTALILLLASGWLPADPEISYAVQVVAVLVLATVWRRLLGRGPLERAVAVFAGRARDAVRQVGWVAPD